MFNDNFGSRQVHVLNLDPRVSGEMVVAPPGVSGQNAPMTQSSLSDDEPPPLEAVEVSLSIIRVMIVVDMLLRGYMILDW